MPLHEFSPGEVAKSSELNDNFQLIMSILGSDSTPDRVDKFTEFTMGPRKTTLVTSSSDTGLDGFEFHQVTWNADFNYSSGAWKFVRVISDRPAMATRLGRDGFHVMGTEKTSGSLNPQMESLFIVKPSDSGHRVVIYPDTNGMIINGPAEHVGHYRLSYVPLESPGIIYDNQSLTKNLVVLKAKDYGVHTNAKAISVTAHAKATNVTDAAIRIYQERSPSSRHRKYGVSLYSPLGNGGIAQTAGIWGIIPLGFGAFAGKFVVERTEAFASVFLAVTGYWV